MLLFNFSLNPCMTPEVHALAKIILSEVPLQENTNF